MTRRFLSSLILGFVFLAAAPVSADLLISSQTVSVTPGSTAIVDFYASDPDGTGTLTGFNLPIDVGFGLDGDGIPADLAFPTLTNPFGANNSLNDFTGLGLNFDFVVNVAQPPSLVLTATPQLVFSLEFAVNGGATVGQVFDLNVVTTGTAAILIDADGTDIGGPFDSTTNPLTAANFSPGQISITAVPEPASCLLLVAGPLAVVARRRRMA